jgi:hypothetical protein
MGGLFSACKKDGDAVIASENILASPYATPNGKAQVPLESPSRTKPAPQTAQAAEPKEKAPKAVKSPAATSRGPSSPTNELGKAMAAYQGKPEVSCLYTNVPYLFNVIANP